MRIFPPTQGLEPQTPGRRWPLHREEASEQIQRTGYVLLESRIIVKCIRCVLDLHHVHLLFSVGKFALLLVMGVEI